MGVSATSVALRWVVWHSLLGEGDGVILGAMSEEMIRGNVGFIEKDPQRMKKRLGSAREYGEW